MPDNGQEDNIGLNFVFQEPCVTVTATKDQGGGNNKVVTTTDGSGYVANYWCEIPGGYNINHQTNNPNQITVSKIAMLKTVF